jgi:hypothetical protein
LLYSLVWTWYLLYGHAGGKLYKPEWYSNKERPEVAKPWQGERKKLSRTLGPALDGT